MKCKCGSERFASVQGKCSDRSSANIPHLDIDHDGYVPDLGVGRGDYIEVEFCLDCGQIPNWTPITDEMILAMEEFEIDPIEEAVEEELVENEPDIIDLKRIEKQRIIKLMEHSYGAFWHDHAEARDVLFTTLEKDDCGPAMRAAIKELLK